MVLDSGDEDGRGVEAVGLLRCLGNNGKEEDREHSAGATPSEDEQPVAKLVESSAGLFFDRRHEATGLRKILAVGRVGPTRIPEGATEQIKRHLGVATAGGDVAEVRFSINHQMVVRAGGCRCVLQ